MGDAPAWPPSLAPRATQQAKQQGFGLIVTMLAGEHHLPCPGHFGKRPVARLPRCALNAGTRLDLHTHHLQGHAQLVTYALAMTWPGIGGSLQTMMDMDCAEGRQGFGVCQGGQEVQQDGGIKAAREGDMPGGGVAPRGEVSQKFGG